MNLPTGWQEAIANSPLLIAFLALIGVSLVVLFIAPSFFKIAKKAKFPARLSFLKRHPKRSLAAVLIVLVAVFGGYAYYYFHQPVRIVTAVEFKLEEGKQVEQLQQKGLSGWQEAGIYLLDVRSREEYAKGHLKGSVSSPAEVAAKESYPIKNVAVVVYSGSSQFAEARRTADAIKKNGKSAKRSLQEKFGKIYIIRDGFEGLKRAGLTTEARIWD